MPKNNLGQRFTEMLDSTATKEEVAAMVKQLIDFLKQFKADMQKQVAEHKDGLSLSTTDAMNAHMQEMADFEARLTAIANDAKKVTESEIRTLTRLLQWEVKRMEAMIPDPTDLSPLTVKIEQSIAELQAKIPSLPEELSATGVRDKLETLKGNERLDISAIKGVEELEKKLEERISSVANRRVQTPAKAFMIHKVDCTSQCDGANKTFTVGGTHFGIVGVFGTQFPLIYRPIIDYTETATGFLLTSAVSAPDTGQTLVAQFLK